jgi:hypothetical protein
MLASSSQLFLETRQHNEKSHAAELCSKSSINPRGLTID